MFGFPKVDHERFQKNFLRSFIFQISFESNNNIESKSEYIQNFFKDEFPRFTSAPSKEFEISFSNLKSASFQQNEKGVFLDMRSLDGEKILNITDSQITLTMSGKVYESFNRLDSLIKKIVSILEVLSIDYINRIAIRKINIIEFKINEGEQKAPIDILEQLLNPRLTNEINYLPKRENINHYIQSLNYNIDEDFVNIRYGLNVPDPNNTGQVIIDIDLYSKINMAINQIDIKAKHINSEIFNIFNWVVSDNTIKILKQ